jgi:hypothetical protein
MVAIQRPIQQQKTAPGSGHLTNRLRSERNKINIFLLRLTLATKVIISQAKE